MRQEKSAGFDWREENSSGKSVRSWRRIVDRKRDVTTRHDDVKTIAEH